MDRSDSLVEDSDARQLRKKAESRLEELDAADHEEMSPDQMRREIQLQRIEIDLQEEQIEHYKQQLDQSRERFRDLYFNAPVGYISLDEQGRIEELNYLAAELLGTCRQQMPGTRLSDYILSGCRPKLQKHLNETVKGSGMHQSSFSVELPTGDITHLKILSVAVDDPETGQLQCRCAVYDITEQYEAKLQRDRLEEQLQHSHRLQTIGRLASGIAHDFNNLLTLIIGYSKLAINQLADDHSLAKHVRQINKAGHQAGELIDQLLAFSRASDSQQTAIDPNELIENMTSMFDRLIGDEIELHVRLHEEVGTIRFDTAQFKQVVLNLVVNARDAMPEGGNLYLRTRNVTLTDQAAERIDLEGGSHVVIEIEDEGDGIPPDVIPHIFEPFFTTKSAHNQQGFGLSTTYGIVRRHRGAIDVVSDPDSGTTFCIYLPRLGEDEIDEQHNRPVVLVVDDQADLRDFASLVIEELDVEVLTATSPEEAVQMSQACGPELALVVADVTMPGMSGPQLVDRIRRIHTDTSVLYISGYDRSTLHQEADLDLSAPLLEKPFSPDSLKEMVSSLLDDQ